MLVIADVSCQLIVEVKLLFYLEIINQMMKWRNKESNWLEERFIELKHLQDLLFKERKMCMYKDR